MKEVNMKFESFEALQQSLVLLPRIEEEAIGAINSQDNRILETVNGETVRDLAFADILGILRKSTLIELEFGELCPAATMVLEEKKTEESVVSVFSSWTSRVSAAAATTLQKRQLPVQNDSTYTIYLQNETGAYIQASSSSANAHVTNASILTVRKSPKDALPYHYKVQWCREDDNGTATELENATSNVFLPTAMEVGYRLVCRVTDDDDETESCRSSVVRMAAALFHGASQALTLSNFTGRGLAESRSISMDISKDECGLCLKLYQVCAQTPEPLHEQPIRELTPRCDYGHSKYLELDLQNTNANSLLAALCENGTLQLQAPNRLARETFLIAVGIAKAKEPVDASSMLYGTCNSRTVPAERTVGDEPVQVISKLEEKEAVNPVDETDSTSSDDDNDEIQRLCEKLARKDKIIAELQRHLASSEKSNKATQQSLDETRSELTKTRQSSNSLQQSLDASRQQIESLESSHEQQLNENKESINKLNDRIERLEKAKLTLQNENDVLNAGVKARDNKLEKLQQVTQSLKEAESRVAQQQDLEHELETYKSKVELAQQQLEQMEESESSLYDELKQSELQIEQLSKDMEGESAKYKSQASMLEKERLKLQKLKAERNSYKQKFDSLSKEMNRICKHHTVREIESILADDAAKTEELSILRQQKRAAVAESEKYRQQYATLRSTENSTESTRNLLERNTELERLLSELTEYVSAKEMQVGTLKQVNDALQTEIRDLAKANRRQNEI